MFWIIGILVFIGVFIFMLALCKVAGEDDRRMEEMYQEAQTGIVTKSGIVVGMDLRRGE